MQIVSEILKRCETCSLYDGYSWNGDKDTLHCRMPGYSASYKLYEERTAASVAVCRFYDPKPVVKPEAKEIVQQSLLFDVGDLPNERL